MTWEKVLNAIMALVVIGLPTYALLYSSLGIMGRVKATLLFAPLISLFVVMSNWHLPALLFCNAFPFVLPQIVGHREIYSSIVLPFLVFGGYLARIAIMKPSSVAVRGTDRWIDAAMRMTSAFVVAWLLVSRPRMASLGAETGGAWESMMALSGIAAYWGARSLRLQSYNWKKLVLVTLWAGIIGLTWTAIEIQLRHRTLSDFFAAAFFSTGWWFYGMALGMAVKIWYSPSRRFGMLPAYIIAILVVANSIMSGFRSRIFFAPLMIGAAFWCGHLRKSVLLFVLTFLCAATFFANTELGRKLPERARRVLSPLKMGQQMPDVWSEGESGEWGARSPWRMAIWQEGWAKIREHPFRGHGYAFSGAELFADVASASTADEAIVRGLVMSGEFHAVPLNLMYYLGIPVALLFCSAWLLTFRRLVSLASLSDGWYGALVTGILVYLIAVTGQALTTGGGFEFMGICTVMGICQAIAPDRSVAPASGGADQTEQQESAERPTP